MTQSRRPRKAEYFVTRSRGTHLAAYSQITGHRSSEAATRSARLQLCHVLKAMESHVNEHGRRSLDNEEMLGGTLRLKIPLHIHDRFVYRCEGKILYEVRLRNSRICTVSSVTRVET